MVAISRSAQLSFDNFRRTPVDQNQTRRVRQCSVTWEPPNMWRCAPGRKSRFDEIREAFTRAGAAAPR